MFINYRSLLKSVFVPTSCVRFFALTSCRVGNEINPISLFRLYDPYFSSPHYLPIEFKDSNKIFSWPQAVMKSIRSEIESVRNDTEVIVQELKTKENATTPIDPQQNAIHLISLANLYLETLNVDKCEVVLKSAIDILSCQDSLDSAKLLSEAYQQLAMTKQLKKEYSIAVSLYQKALKHSEKIFRGRHHPSQAKLCTILGMAYATVDMPTEFENCYQHIIASMKTCFPDSPKMWVNIESSLAVIYQRQGKYNEAILLHEQCYQTYCKMNNNRINPFIEKLNWAATLIVKQDFAQAKKLLEEVEDFLVRQPSINPIFLKITSSNLDICRQPCVKLSMP